MLSLVVHAGVTVASVADKKTEITQRVVFFYVMISTFIAHI